MPPVKGRREGQGSATAVPLCVEPVNPVFRSRGFDAIEGWRDDDHIAAFGAFRSGAAAIAATPPKTRALGVSGSALAGAAAAALALDGPVARDQARAFFERHFRPFAIAADGFVTGYYEPQLAASRTRSGRFSVPLYRRPDDLVDVDDTNRPDGWDPDMRFGRATESGLQPFHDRAAIEAGALAGRGLELAWLESAVDAFFVHIQGSACLRLAEGGMMRIAFAAKSGHPYTAIGRLAVERGLLPLAAADKDGLEAWLKNNARLATALMRENRSFIFFRHTDQDEGEGPIGAAGVPLTPGRSLAVDRMLHTFHTPIWVNAQELADFDAAEPPFRRLMIAHDTGSAIVGAARGDLYWGSGRAAGSRAGRIRHAAKMVALLPVVATDQRG